MKFTLSFFVRIVLIVTSWSIVATGQDADNDGIYDTIDPNPGVFDAPIIFTGTNYTFTLHGSGRFATYQNTDTNFAPVLATGGRFGKLEAVSQTVYDHLDDAFDFVIVVSDQDTVPTLPPSIPTNFTRNVKNEVEGIGRALFSDNDEYGSDFQLQAVTHLIAKDQLRTGSSLRELLKRWANYILPGLSPEVNQDGWKMANIGGQYGGWKDGTLVNLGGGNYTANNGVHAGFGLEHNGGNVLPYGPFELYLMGLKEPLTVHDIALAQGASKAIPGVSSGSFTASSVPSISMAVVISSSYAGPRVPAVVDAQKGFRAIYVVVIDAPISFPRLASYDEEVYTFSLASSDGDPALYNFWEATEQAATLQFDELNCLVTPESIPSNIVTVTGPTELAPSEQGTFTFNSVAVASDYQVEIFQTEATNFLEGAEVSPAPQVIDHTSLDYELLSTFFRKTGSRSFHLAFSDPVKQWFEIDRDLFVSTNSVLTFQALKRLMDTESWAAAEIGGDGPGWTEVWRQDGDGNLSNIWNPVSVSLGAFTGRTVRVRFILDTGLTFSQGTTGSNGIFFDDISVSNVEAPLGLETVNLAGGLTSFNYTPSSEGFLRMRMQAYKDCQRLGQRSFHFVTVAQPLFASIDDVIRSESDPTASFTVVLDQVPTSPVTLDWMSRDGSATAGEDYVAATGSLTFNPGFTSQVVNITLLDDVVDELDEVFFIDLTNLVGASFLNAEGQATLLDDDALPQISINSVASDEDSGPMTFTVVLDRPSSQTITVDVDGVDDSALAGDDYLALSTSLSFAPGVTSQTVNVSLVNDSVNEAGEQFFVQLSSPVNAGVTTAQGVGSIADDDPLPVFVLGAASVDESAGVLNYPVTLSAISAQTISLDIGLSNLSATFGQDYGIAANSVTLPPGILSTNFPVPILEDTLDEADETFLLLFVSPVNAVLTNGSATVTVLDNDLMPNLSISDAAGPESNSSLAFTVSLDAASAKAISVAYTSSNQSAVAGSDYTVVSGTLNFPAGTTNLTVLVSLMEDALDEADETFSLSLSGPSNAGIGDGEGVVTIFDNDGPPNLAVDDLSVAEGDVASFVVSLDEASGLTVEVDLVTSNESAHAGLDYVSTSEHLIFAPGETQKIVAVSCIQDAVDEEDETFAVLLSNPSNAVISDPQGQGVIADDDAPPALSIGDAGADETDLVMTFTVTLDAPSEKVVTVLATSADVSATAGADYVLKSQTLSFPTGIVTQSFTIDILEDALDEPSETFHVVLSSPSNATIADGMGAGSITDNDVTPILSIAGVNGGEGDGTFSFVVSLNAASGQAISADVVTSDATAIDGEDYTAVAESLSFTPGETQKVFVVTILDDLLDETSEDFRVLLTNAVNVALATNEVSGLITDNDNPPGISILDVPGLEGDGTFTFNVTLDVPSAMPVSVGYATMEQTAMGGSDFIMKTGVVTIAAMELLASVDVMIVDDLQHEAAETFILVLTNAMNGVLVDAEGLGTISDDDALPSLSVADVSVNEGDGVASFSVVLSAPSGQTVQVDVATSNQTAVAGSDYSPNSQTLNFAPGVTSQMFSVLITDDSLDEASEVFQFILSNPTAASIADGSADVHIEDDDDAPGISVEAVFLTEQAGTAVLTVELDAPSGRMVTVQYATSNETAVAGLDYAAQSGELMFNPGESSQSIIVTLLDDFVDEDLEAFTVWLSSPLEATLLVDRARAFILDNDRAPGILIDDILVNEADGTAGFTVRLDNISGKVISAQASTADDTAIAPGDYSAISEALTFAPGVTSQTFSVILIDDATVESAEQFMVNLSMLVNVTPLDVQAAAIVEDDDEPLELRILGIDLANGRLDFEVLSGIASQWTLETASHPDGPWTKLSTGSALELGGSQYRFMWSAIQPYEILKVVGQP
jgi:hypothetical protein